MTIIIIILIIINFFYKYPYYYIVVLGFLLQLWNELYRLFNPAIGRMDKKRLKAKAEEELEEQEFMKARVSFALFHSLSNSFTIWCK